MRKLKLRGKLTGQFFFIVKRSSTSYRVGKKFSLARMRGFVSNIYDLYRGVQNPIMFHRKLQATNQKLTAKSAHDREKSNHNQYNISSITISDGDFEKTNLIETHAESNQ